MRNTIRHAGAHHVHVRLGFEPDGLEFAVTDDGRGFAPDNADEVASGHLGLLGMAKRASLLGGHPEVQSAPGKRGARPRDPPARPPRTRPAVPPRG